MNKRWLGLWVGLLLWGLAMPAWAHKVSVFAYAEAGQLKGEGYFASGDKARDCEVTLLDAQGRVLASARSDAQGQFSLPLPSAAPPLKLVLDAGQGHQASYTLQAADLGQEQGQTPPPAPAAIPETLAQTPPPAASAPGLDSAQVEAMINRALDQKLEPIKAQLARLQAERGFDLRDIVGAMGYILGLMGLAAYLKSRHRDQ